MGLHTRLQRRKESGIYYCRVAIPKHLHHVIGKREIYTSLKTSDHKIARELVKAESLKIDKILAEASGRKLLDTVSERPYRSIIQKPLQQGSITFSDLVDMFFRLPEKSLLAADTKQELQATYRMLGEVLGNDTAITDISRTDCRRVQEILTILPANYTKRFPDMRIIQVVEHAKKKGIEPMGILTANKYLTRLAGLLKWAYQEGMITKNPAQGLLLKDNERMQNKRHPFSTEQLNLLFNNDLMKGYKKDNHPRWWIPVLALWTGARLNELCQLHAKDVVQKDGIYCLVIESSEDKRLKTVNSKRMIPIHPQLIELGFVNYAVKTQKQGHKRLFPKLSINKNGNTSDQFSKWFARYLVAIGLKSKKICFHSFRHTFRDALREAGITRELVQALGGWRDSTAGVEDIYGSGFGNQKLYKAICKIKYSVFN